MATAIAISQYVESPEIISEVAPPGTASEDIPEVNHENLPEHTVRPDKETSDLIAAVIRVADEFLPAHTKLSLIICKHREEIIALKRKFGVHKGSAGHRLPIPTDGKNIPLYWEDFVRFHFGVTSRRLNQLLQINDDPELGISRFKRPDVEKPLYKKGFEAGKKVNQEPQDIGDWTDNKFIETCVDFVGSTLRHLESEPERFATVAAAIAEQIFRRLGKKNDADQGTNDAPESKAVPIQ